MMAGRRAVSGFGSGRGSGGGRGNGSGRGDGSGGRGETDGSGVGGHGSGASGGGEPSRFGGSGGRGCGSSGGGRGRGASGDGGASGCGGRGHGANGSGEASGSGGRGRGVRGGEEANDFVGRGRGASCGGETSGVGGRGCGVSRGGREVGESSGTGRGARGGRRRTCRDEGDNSETDTHLAYWDDEGRQVVPVGVDADPLKHGVRGYSPGGFGLYPLAPTAIGISGDDAIRMMAGRRAVSGFGSGRGSRGGRGNGSGRGDGSGGRGETDGSGVGGHSSGASGGGEPSRFGGSGGTGCGSSGGGRGRGASGDGGASGGSGGRGHGANGSGEASGSSGSGGSGRGVRGGEEANDFVGRGRGASCGGETSGVGGRGCGVSRGGREVGESSGTGRGARGGRRRTCRDEGDNSETDTHLAYWDDEGRQVVPVGVDADPLKHRVRGYSPGGFGLYPLAPTSIGISGDDAIWMMAGRRAVSGFGSDRGSGGGRGNGSGRCDGSGGRGETDGSGVGGHSSGASGGGEPSRFGGSGGRGCGFGGGGRGRGASRDGGASGSTDTHLAYWDDEGRQVVPVGVDADPLKHRVRGYSPGGFGLYPLAPTAIGISGDDAIWLMAGRRAVSGFGSDRGSGGGRGNGSGRCDGSGGRGETDGSGVGGHSSGASGGGEPSRFGGSGGRGCGFGGGGRGRGASRDGGASGSTDTHLAYWDDEGRQVVPVGVDADPLKHRVRGYSPGGFGLYPLAPTAIGISGDDAIWMMAGRRAISGFGSGRGSGGGGEASSLGRRGCGAGGDGGVSGSGGRGLGANGGGEASGSGGKGREASGVRVGLIYDERMAKHKFSGRTGHPERPKRITSIWKAFQSDHIHRRCVILNAEEAKDEHIALVHKKDQIDLIKTWKKSSKLHKDIAKEFDVYFSEGSLEAAYVAAGSVIKVAEKVAERELDSAFAVVRPPGHHAEEDQSMGFCLFNNVGIATRYLLDQRPELGIKKILIVDWDIHHGNGTQKIFYENRRVLFFSVHRYTTII